MRRPLFLWILFGVSIGSVLAALGWMTSVVLDLDRADLAARTRAGIEERSRLALWRMDSLLSPLVTQEILRPVSSYTSSGERVPGPPGDVPAPRILLRFQVDSSGVWTSPELAHPVRFRGAAIPPDPASGREAIEAEPPEVRLAELANAVSIEELEAAHTESAAALSRLLATAPGVEDGSVADRNPETPPGESGDSGDPTWEAPHWPNPMVGSERLEAESVRQTALNSLEGRFRALTCAPDAVQQLVVSNTRGVVDPFLRLPETAPRPLWIDGRLLLVRRVSVAGETVYQGSWLDWPAIRSWLLDSVRDLLPAADLVAAPLESSEGDRRLASLPVAVVPGDPPNLPQAVGATPARVSLALAWGASIVAVLAVAILFAGLAVLSERRRQFVAAVTHELRTPLTTFRMYTEMLGEGMVGDPARRASYLARLQNEADRLSHLVENVLAYARLEMSRPDRHSESIAVDEMARMAEERLSERARAAEMELVVTVDPRMRSLHVRADRAAIERILLNLVDNASKYAAEARDRRVHVDFTKRTDHISVRIRDHGPGLPTDVAKRLFRPFGKSVKEAARSKPGVGLGLALSRRSARATGGDLQPLAVDEGACFELTLPIDAAPRNKPESDDGSRDRAP